MALILGILEQLLHPKDENGNYIKYADLDPRVYFSLAADGEELGVVNFRLAKKTIPEVVDTFCRLCENKKGDSYRGTPLHSIFSEKGIIVGGNISRISGHMAEGISICGSHSLRKSFDPPTVEDIKPGTLFLLSEKIDGRSEDLTQFGPLYFIVIDPKLVEKLGTGDVLQIGHVEEGLEILENILKEYGTVNGSPTKKELMVIDCGRY